MKRRASAVATNVPPVKRRCIEPESVTRDAQGSVHKSYAAPAGTRGDETLMLYDIVADGEKSVVLHLPPTFAFVWNHGAILERARFTCCNAIRLVLIGPDFTTDGTAVLDGAGSGAVLLLPAHYPPAALTPSWRAVFRYDPATARLQFADGRAHRNYKSLFTPEERRHIALRLRQECADDDDA
jgi:hypothetical protein